MATEWVDTDRFHAAWPGGPPSDPEHMRIWSELLPKRGNAGRTSHVTQSSARDKSAAVLSVHNFWPSDEISKQMRVGVPAKMRRDIWLTVSGGRALKHRAPESFRQALHGAMRIGPDALPDARATAMRQHPAPTFGYYGPMPQHCLTSEGLARAHVAMCAIAYDHQETVFCPWVPLVVLACLHWMDEADTFFVVCGLLREPSQLIETRIAAWLMLFAFDELARDQLRRPVQRLSAAYGMPYPPPLSHEHPLAGFWLGWLARMPLPLLTRFVDVFISEGIKIVYRFGLATLSFYDEASRPPSDKGLLSAFWPTGPVIRSQSQPAGLFARSAPSSPVPQQQLSSSPSRMIAPATSARVDPQPRLSLPDIDAFSLRMHSEPAIVGSVPTVLVHPSQTPDHPHAHPRPHLLPMVFPEPSTAADPSQAAAAAPLVNSALASVPLSPSRPISFAKSARGMASSGGSTGLGESPKSLSGSPQLPQLPTTAGVLDVFELLPDPDRFLKRAFGFRFSRTTIRDSTSKHYAAAKTAMNLSGLSLAPGEVYQPHRRGSSFGSAVDTKVVDASAILDDDQWRVLWAAMPTRFQMKEAHLIFSTATNGYSLQTLLSAAVDEAPTILVVRTTNGDIFGAYCSYPWNYHEVDGRHFGNGETFLFQCHPGDTSDPCTVYPWVGIAGPADAPEANLFMLVKHDYIGVGGGPAGHGIHLNKALQGHSQPSPTFASPSLSCSALGHFAAATVELWAFRAHH